MGGGANLENSRTTKQLQPQKGEKLKATAKHFSASKWQKVKQLEPQKQSALQKQVYNLQSNFIS